MDRPDGMLPVGQGGRCRCFISQIQHQCADGCTQGFQFALTCRWQRCAMGGQQQMRSLTGAGDVQRKGVPDATGGTRDQDSGPFG